MNISGNATIIVDDTNSKGLNSLSWREVRR
jgi:hypothetical protein